jgi:hypothetical protein
MRHARRRKPLELLGVSRCVWACAGAPPVAG